MRTITNSSPLKMKTLSIHFRKPRKCTSDIWRHLLKALKFKFINMTQRYHNMNIKNNIWLKEIRLLRIIVIRIKVMINQPSNNMILTENRTLRRSRWIIKKCNSVTRSIQNRIFNPVRLKKLLVILDILRKFISLRIAMSIMRSQIKWLSLNNIFKCNNKTWMNTKRSTEIQANIAAKMNKINNNILRKI